MKNKKWLMTGAFVVILLVIIFQLQNTAEFRSPAARPGTVLTSANAPLPTNLISINALLSRTNVDSNFTPQAGLVSSSPAGSSLEAFGLWAEHFMSLTNAGDKASALQEGGRLARERRAELLTWIKTNPRLALQQAAPWRWRQNLPAGIVELLEDRVEGQARLDVYCAMPLPGADYHEFAGGAIRYITLNNKSYRAYVYGRRVQQMTRKDLPVSGIAIENVMAVAEEPLRLMESDEAESVAKEHTAKSPSGCALCGAFSTSSNAAVLAAFGKQILRFCNPAHASDFNRALVAAEEASATGIQTDQHGASSTPSDLASTYGIKKVLYMRVVFEDDSEIPIGAEEAASVMEKVNDFYVEVSFNKTALISTITPVLTLPQTKMYYAVQGPGALAEDAGAAARDAGYDADNFDLRLIRHTNVPGFTWGGLGGGGTAWLQSSSPGVAAHEIGHNYGLPHANFWLTRRDALPPNPSNLPFDADSLVGRDSIIGAGDDVSYGDPYDIMGSGGGESTAGADTNVISTLNGHFNAIGKYLLGWLPQSYVIRGDTSATNRIFVHDTPNLVRGRSYALALLKDEQRVYWLSARSRFADVPWLQNGVELHWSPWQQAVGYSQLLDVTPGSKEGSADSAIQIGHTFSDKEANIHITPVAKGGIGTETWYDVVVNRGPFTNNEPPKVEFSQTTSQAGIRTPVTFSASASDSNGDRLAFFWDFGDGSFGENTASVGKSWSSPGDYVVRCEVSDMKGGVTSKHMVVRVGAPETLRMSGQVYDTFGHPLQGVRVSSGSITNNDLAPEYQWTYTDSDGAFTLVNLTTNTLYPVGAYLGGYVTKPLNFVPPVSLTDRDAVDVRFQAQPLPVVTVRTLADATIAPAKPGQFELSRTGDTNTSMTAVFVLGGTAGTNDFKPYTNMVTHTNWNPNPFGVITSMVNFAYVQFATGVFKTNIVITPSTNAAAGEDKYVSLTMMNALQAQRISMVTNTNWVNFTGWEIKSVRGQDTWFQTDPDYAPGYISDSKVYLRGKAPALPTVSIVASDPTATENKNDSGMFTLTRYGRLDLAVTVLLDIGGSAMAGENYEALPASVVIPAGQTYLNLPVIARPNLYLDGHKSVIVRIPISPAYNTGASEASVTIGDNDMPLVTIAAGNGVANAADNTLGTLMVTRVGDMDRSLTVNYLVTGTASSGLDYRALPGSILIPAGQPSASIQVTPRRNASRVGDRDVVVFVSDSPSYNIGTPGAASIIIQDSTLPTVSVIATNSDSSGTGANNAFAIRRTGDISRELRVSFEVGGTARPLVDYSPIGDSVTFPARSGEVIIAVVAVNNGIKLDPAPNVALVLSPRPEYNLKNQNYAAVTLSGFDNGQIAVGFAQLASRVMEQGGDAEVAVVVSANPPENANVTVDYRIIGGTALPGVDYDATNTTGRLVFTNNPNGGADAYLLRAQLISLKILDNTNAPPDRTIVLALEEPAPDLTNEIVTNIVEDATDPTVSVTNVVTNLVVTPVSMNAVFDTFQSHTLTIVSQGPSIVTVEATDPAAREEGVKAGLITIRRTGTAGAQKVYFAMSGHAVNGDDYQTIASPVEIPDGQDAIAIPVIPVDDSVQEYMEDVTLTLLDAPAARLGDPSSATVNIVDNTGAIEFSATSYIVTESVGTALIPIRRTGDTSVVASVEYNIAPAEQNQLPDSVFVSISTSAPTNPVPAISGVDFIATNGVVTFNPGEQLQYIPVVVLNDSLVEPPKIVSLSLRKAGDGAPLGGQDTAALTIMDDDSAVEFSQAVYRANENGTNALVTVRRIGVATNAFAVDFATADSVATNGAARAGVDYMATNGILRFDPGQMEAAFKVAILDNAFLEGDRTALLVLTNVAGNAVLGSQTNAVLSIVDDECTLQFTAAGADVAEYEGFASITVRRSGGTVNPVSVSYTTVAGAARPNKDFIPVSGTLSFGGDYSALAPDGSGIMQFHPGETNKTIRVQIVDNVLGDGDRQFQLALTNPKGPSNAMAGSAKLGTRTNILVTIRDNEMPGNVDYEFNPGQGADGPVLSVALQSDGKVLLGGAFTRVDDVMLNHVARLHTDGYLDSFLNPGDGADGTVYAITVQPNGRVLLGGEFSRVNGFSVNNLARLNADGTVDVSFNPAGGPNRAVRAIAVQSDGGILVGGDFTTVNGVNRSGIARLNPDGSLDAKFNPGAGAVGGNVLAVLALPGGKLLAAGSFSSLGGAGKPFLARLNTDGSPDGSFAAAGGPDRPVQTLALMTDGRVVAGGGFSFFAGMRRAGVVRLNQDGLVDESFDPGSGASGAVLAVGAQADGKIVAGGAFTNFNGFFLNRLVRLNPDGSVDDTFDIGSGANDTVRTLTVEPDSSIVIGGDFTSFRGLGRARIARVHGDDKYVFNRIQFASSEYRVVEDAGQCVISVRRDGDTNIAASVNFLTIDGAAKAGVNYVATNGVLQFAAGDTVKTFSVAILNDGRPKNDLTAKLVLTNLPAGFSLGAQLTATLTIEGLGGAFGFGSPNYVVNKSDGMATVTVERTGAARNPATIDYSTSDGTAVAGFNYTTASGTLTFGAGVMSRSFTVPILNGALAEPDKTVTVALSNPQGATVLGVRNNAVLTIHDDNQGPSFRVDITPAAGGVVTPRSGSFPAGSLRTFTAAPDPDFIFARWTGTTNSNLNPLTLSMDRDYSLTAVFRPKTYTYDFAPPFASTNLSRAPWSNSGDLPWRLKEPGEGDDGRYSLLSGPVRDKQQSIVELAVNTRAGSGSFDLRVSSEEGWDFLEFRLNGTVVRKWSGEIPWQSFQFNLPQGVNQLSWRYVKDNTFGAGLDAAFISNLYLPVEIPRATLQASREPGQAIQIRVQAKAGQISVLEASDDLLLWLPISTNSMPADTIQVTDPEAIGHPQRFYRAITR